MNGVIFLRPTCEDIFNENIEETSTFEIRLRKSKNIALPFKFNNFLIINSCLK